MKKLFHFGTFYDENNIGTEVMVMASDNLKEIFIKFEKPDEIYGFKSAKINLYQMVVEEREGFSDSEISHLIQLCKNNLEIIKSLSKEVLINANSI